MRCSVCSVVVLCALSFHLGLIEAQWAIDDAGCRTPDRGVGTCIPIRDCQPILTLLEESPKPLPPRIVAYLRRFQCGSEQGSVKVCCPERPLTTTFANKPPNVNRHQNLGLLPLKTCGLANLDNKIINGNKTGIFEFPWMALISYQTSSGPEFKCGGTIINRRYILTAAHCISNLKNLRLAGVRIGDHNYRTPVDCEISEYGEQVCAPPFQDIAIEDILPHPDFNVTAITHDIGLLRLARDIDLASFDSVKAVCLPTGPMANFDFANKNVIVTGWGVTEKGRSSPELLKVELPVVPNDSCQKIYKNARPVTYRQMCAGGRNRDSCAGDSGGPLHVVGTLNNDVRFVQQGIVSYGPVNCGLEGFPAVYTRVSYYMDWILNTIRS